MSYEKLELKNYQKKKRKIEAFLFKPTKNEGKTNKLKMK